ncbi:hypothetical protein VCHA43P282_20009 [Vibrio chagasii]|nr:hypothetical protein VCHA43P282_20009 [Vibrio chagasii]
MTGHKLSFDECSSTKKTFELEEIWRVRTRLENENDLMQLTLLNLTIEAI